MQTCCIKDCGKKVLAKGMCAMHYQRVRLYGDPTKTMVKQMHGATLQQRFDHYVSRSEGCWEWTGSRDSNGYGRLNVSGKPELAHRLSWRLHVGEISPDQHVLHRCDNPPCVRPDHLFLGDQIANNADMKAKGRFRPGVSKGEAHGGAVLTEAQVREIRQSTDKPQHIADQFGISRRQVRDIRAMRSWRHIS
jgi:hypothetical protein